MLRRPALRDGSSPMVHYERLRYWCRRILIGSYDWEEASENIIFHAVKAELRRSISEFVGTFFLVIFVAGIEVVDVFSAEMLSDDIYLCTKGLVSAFILTGLIYSFGSISGAHFNPVVTMAFFMRGLFTIQRLALYVGVQFCGALAGAAVLLGIFGDVKSALGTPMPGGSNNSALAVEILMTYVFVTSILATAEKSRILGPQSALAVGATFGATQLFGWNVSGSAVNPWRALAPAIVSGEGLGTIWIYFVGPIIGAIIAVILQRILTPIRDQDTALHIARGEGENAPQEDAAANSEFNKADLKHPPADGSSAPIIVPETIEKLAGATII